MSEVIRRIARVSLLAVVIGFAPAASAVAPSSPETEETEVPADGLLARATVQAAGETAAPGAIDVWMAEAVRVHEDTQEDLRISKVVHDEAADLKPGRYVWRPDLASDGPVEIVVSIAAQRAYVFRDRRLIAVSTVSTGKKGHSTPTGSYPILQKKKMHFSNLYNNAPMPNMQRLTWDGVALHAGAIPGYPASHGCVRLPAEFSKLLFGITKMETVVHIIAEEPVTGMAALDHAAVQTGRSGIFKPREPRKPKPPSRA